MRELVDLICDCEGLSESGARHRISAMLEAGTLERLDRGVYRVVPGGGR